MLVHSGKPPIPIPFKNTFVHPYQESAQVFRRACAWKYKSKLILNDHFMHLFMSKETKFLAPVSTQK